MADIIKIVDNQDLYRNKDDLDITYLNLVTYLLTDKQIPRGASLLKKPILKEYFH